ncbi:MAG: hypothetical protein CMA49_08705 [Euryarchaeota archaeon]|nr:hypothetical protein [Euryarchaeota archaeon]MBF54697.1 hypothetical protein [Euryarchaeota archaeon]
MPGSPYLEEPPPGLLTWPILLRLVVPTFTALGLASWWMGYLLEFLTLLTVTGMVAFVVRR